MKKNLISFIFLLLFMFCGTGCALRDNRLTGATVLQPQRAATLWRIRVSHKNVTRFSGIMGLEQRDGGVYCIVLDATGLPLLEGIVGPDSSLRLSRCLEQARQRRFPELIARVVNALYFVPFYKECPWYAMSCASRIQCDNSFVAHYRWGPLMLWHVTGTGGSNSPFFQNVTAASAGRARQGEILPQRITVSFDLQGVDFDMRQMRED